MLFLRFIVYVIKCSQIAVVGALTEDDLGTVVEGDIFFT